MNEWMKWNYLLVNDTINTCLPVVPKSATAIVNRLRVLVGQYDVVLAEHIRTLSVHLSIPLYVSRTISTYSLHIRVIGLIHRYFTQPTAERGVNVIVTPRLAYSNVLLYGTANNNIAQLQLVARNESTTADLCQLL
ncbi:hypothetical protein NP493_1165g00032 [Ridgeia piscesae]|uniref:Uncharacterized protein n=1 Tax=Ridgeia piscesae TaxID=27915 RepID=A0AAD9KF48_RIDPI|nr:hypothetical protein NP493_1165g00032 [Ridgeia piscesae]